VLLTPDELLKTWWDRRAYLARYARQSMFSTELDDADANDVRRALRSVSELVKEENLIMGKTETNG